jgi:hypothetical protein
MNSLGLTDANYYSSTGKFTKLCQNTHLTICNLFKPAALLQKCPLQPISAADIDFYDIGDHCLLSYRYTVVTMMLGDGIMTAVSFLLLYYLFYRATVRFSAVGIVM